MATGKRRVDPLRNPDDFKVLLLADFGFGGKAIGEKTNMTRGQVYYRTRKASVRLSDYRKGVGTGANLVLQNAQAMAGYTLEQRLKQ